MKFNLTNTKPLAKVAIGVTALILIIAFISIFSSIKNGNHQDYNPTIPTPTGELPKLKQPTTFQEELTKISSKLPYKGENFTITYKSYINAVEVEINTKNREEYLKVKNTAEEFIKAQGVKDICTLNIFWIPNLPPTNTSEITGLDVITTSCPSLTQ